MPIIEGHYQIGNPQDLTVVEEGFVVEFKVPDKAESRAPQQPTPHQIFWGLDVDLDQVWRNHNRK